MWAMATHESPEHWSSKNYDVFTTVFLYKIEVIYLCICLA